MSNQLPSESNVTGCLSTDDKNVTGTKPTIIFKWTTELEQCLLFNMIGLKPCGIHKHISVYLLKERMRKQLNIDIPLRVIWDYIHSKWDIKAADKIEDAKFDAAFKRDFVLPKEYDQLIAEQREIIRKQEKESANDEIHKKKLLNRSGKTRSKYNSMSSVDSKEGLNETITSTILESSPAKTNEVGSDNGPCARRSLRINEKLKKSKSDEKNKPEDLKQYNKKNSNKSKDVQKIEKISNFRGRKKKSRSVSESSLSSDNSKHRRNYRNSFTNLTISDSSSRSVTPEISRGKTVNRSVTPETISRKSNLRSNDEDQKSKLELVEECLNIDRIMFPVVRIERLNLENEFVSLMEAKSKNLIQSKK